jgi:hypothetical protein
MYDKIIKDRIDEAEGVLGENLGKLIATLLTSKYWFDGTKNMDVWYEFLKNREKVEDNFRCLGIKLFVDDGLKIVIMEPLPHQEDYKIPSLISRYQLKHLEIKFLVFLREKYTRNYMAHDDITLTEDEINAFADNNYNESKELSRIDFEKKFNDLRVKFISKLGLITLSKNISNTYIIHPVIKHLLNLEKLKSFCDYLEILEDNLKNGEGVKGQKRPLDLEDSEDTEDMEDMESTEELADNLDSETDSETDSEEGEE